MKKRTYLFNLINLILILLTYILLVKNSQKENMLLLIGILGAIILGIINSVISLFFSFQDYKQKKINTVELILSLFLSSIFPVFLLISIIANMSDVASLFA